MIRLKTRTGIGQWNIVCRWAFCLSLAEPTPPSVVAGLPTEPPTPTAGLPARVESSSCTLRRGRETHAEQQADSNVEMSWPVFAGEFHELYLAILTARCQRDGLGTSDAVLAHQFRLHLHRGIGYLATPGKVRSIADLVGLGVSACAGSNA